MILLVIAVMIFLPFVIGTGFLFMIKEKEHGAAFGYVTGWLLLFLLTEAAQLPGVLFDWPLQDCILLLQMLLGAVWLMMLAVCIRHRQDITYPALSKGTIIAIGAVVVQSVLFILWQNPYLGEDATIETVQTMLHTNTLYEYHAFTGELLEEGIPLHLQILVLPFLYAAISSSSGILPQIILYEIIPIVMLSSCYMVYSCFAEWLYKGKERGKTLFMLVLALLIQCGNYMTMTDSFRLFHRGYQGESIRNGVILPFAVYLCMTKKWKLLILCIMAEACIVWTTYGFGYTCIMLLLMAGIRFGRTAFCKMQEKKEERA